MYDSFPQNKVVGDVPFYWSELANKVLKFPNHHISVVVTGNRVNRDIGLGIEIPVDYIFHGDNQIIGWFKKSIEKLDKSNDVKVEKCMKYLVKSHYLLIIF